MKLLVLGGTVFVGRGVVEAALKDGHDVTIFHRGSKGTGLIPGAREILGDRDGGLDALGSETWDAVADTCGYVPRIVQQSIDALHGRVETYLFVSTISVYAEPVPLNPDESSPLATLADPTVEEVTGETYGGLKVLCENAVIEAFPDNHLIIRPGLVAGPHDPTNRFTYWVRRIAEGGKVLVPERDEQPMQLIDTRDMGAFMVHGLKQGLTGIYNATGSQISFGEMIQNCLTKSETAEFVYADDETLAKHEVGHWTELPLSLPGGKEDANMMTASSAKAVASGLKYRSLSETTADTLAWALANPIEGTPRFGLDRAKEQGVLDAIG